MDRVLPNLIVPLVLLFFMFGRVGAQDIHYSMFYNAPELLNPALTGIFYGDVRVMGQYRRQWESVPVDYLTFSGNYDMKFYPKNSGNNNFFGFGVNFNYDNSGFSKLSHTQLQLGGSYSAELATNTFLTGGLQIGLSNRAFKEGELTFGNQYDDILSQFDPSLPTGEDFENTSIFFADLSLGVNLRMQNENRRTKLDLGGALYHINQPRQEFFDNSDNKLPGRLSVYAIGAIRIAGPLDLLLRGTAQFQSSYREYVPGASLQIYLDQKRGRELALQVGCNFRLNNVTDAIIPTAELHWRTLGVGFSWDVNVSDFQIATEDKGGPEIWVSYRIVKVKPLSQFKTCPIF